MEQAKLDAIQAKIEKARIRQEETKKAKAQKAVATRIKVNKQSSALLPPKNPKRQSRDQNDDLEFIMDEPDPPVRTSAIAVSKQRSVLNKKDANKRSTLMNAGMSASRMRLQDQSDRRSEVSDSFRRSSTNRDLSPS